jgi:hypothetical protein
MSGQHARVTGRPARLDGQDTSAASGRDGRGARWGW